ncbi:MAG: hypothetical protein LAP86_04480 [Acidobacteriia bacterium]|nr:hypothetical protein [Terriglobia bacterium]
MSVQSATRMSKEQPLVEQMAQTEPDHDGVIEMPDDQEHRNAVVYMVNCALGWVDENYKVRDRLMTSRSLITRIREKSPLYASSIRLRDAERYLWGRAYIPVKLDEDKTRNPTAVRVEAEFADGTYQTMKASLMAANKIFGTSWGKTNPANPFSALGGGDWYLLGLRHYDQFDELHLDEVAEPHRLTDADLSVLHRAKPRYQR